MNYTIKAECDKNTFLNITENSLECKYKDGYTYGFYDDTHSVNDDIMLLITNNIIAKLFDGWNVDGFITFKK